ncbi:MAG: hypothetical protein WCD70_14780 [Alphaproteobacteria bacterium]
MLTNEWGDESKRGVDLHAGGVYWECYAAGAGFALPVIIDNWRIKMASPEFINQIEESATASIRNKNWISLSLDFETLAGIAGAACADGDDKTMQALVDVFGKLRTAITGPSVMRGEETAAFMAGTMAGCGVLLAVALEKRPSTCDHTIAVLNNVETITILNALHKSTNGMHRDELIAATKLNAKIVTGTLPVLEDAGLTRRWRQGSLRFNALTSLGRQAIGAEDVPAPARPAPSWLPGLRAFSASVNAGGG